MAQHLVTSSCPDTLDVEPPRMRVNVLPVVESSSNRTLGAVLELDIDPATTVDEFKTQLCHLLKIPGRRLFVPSLFLATQPLSTISSLDDVDNLVLRRENYLRINAVVATACFGLTTSTAPSADGLIVAVVVSQRAFKGVSPHLRLLSPFDTETFEELLFGDATDESLPPAPSSTWSRVLVRDAYVRIHRIICDNEGVVVTGTSGTGKSVFLWFLLHHLSKTHTVVIDVPGFFLLARPDGTLIAGHPDHNFRAELSRRETVYLSDMRTKTGTAWDWVQAKPIVVADPDRRLLKSYQRGVRPLMPVFMPLWTLEEVIKCRRLCGSVVWGDRYEPNEMGEDEIATMHDTYRSGVRCVPFTIASLTRKELELVRVCAGRDFWKCVLPDEEVYLQLLYVKPSADLLSATLEFASEDVRGGVLYRLAQLVNGAI